MRILADAANGNTEKAAYMAGVVDGLMWLLRAGREEHAHLADHIRRRAPEPFLEIAEGMADIVQGNHATIWDYVQVPARSTKALAAVRPSCSGEWLARFRRRRPADPSLN